MPGSHFGVPREQTKEVMSISNKQTNLGSKKCSILLDKAIDFINTVEETANCLLNIHIPEDRECDDNV